MGLESPAPTPEIHLYADQWADVDTDTFNLTAHHGDLDPVPDSGPESPIIEPPQKHQTAIRATPVVVTTR